MDLVEILSFLFQLSFSTLGKVSKGPELGAWVGELKGERWEGEMRLWGNRVKDKNEQRRTRDGKRGSECMGLGKGEWDVLYPSQPPLLPRITL